MVRAFEPPVYCYHEIVHNKLVVDRFTALGRGLRRRRDRGARPGRRSCCPRTAPHPRSSPRHAQTGGYVVDSVCPLVTKVHHEVKVRAGKGYRIVYVGHEGHEEAVGTMAVAPDAIHRVESRRRRRARSPSFAEPGRGARADDAVAPRLGRRRSTPRRSASPSVWVPGRSDLCFATTNRQSALMAMAPRCDAIVVIGSANSSNTRALEKLARRSRLPLGPTASTRSTSFPTICTASSASPRARRRPRSSSRP